MAAANDRCGRTGRPGRAARSRAPRAIAVVALLALAALAAPVRAADEDAVDPLVLRSLRERLAAGSVREARTALAEIRAAPHGRHGVLLYEAMVRADQRIEACDRRRPELELEREQARAALAEQARSTSPSVQRRLRERLDAVDRELAQVSAQRTVESQLRDVCRATWEEIAPQLSPVGADELAAAFLLRIGEERRLASRALLLEMAGAVASPRVVPALVEHAGEKGEAPELVIAALVALGRRGEASATPAAIGCLGHPDWRVRAEAIEALRRFHRRTAIPFLIEALREATGRMKDDLGFALRSLTGERFVADAAIWRHWWSQHHATFVMPAAPAERPSVPQEGEGGTQFFGIGSFSKRVVFVLDVSGSMHEPMGGTSPGRTKLEVARAHLKSAIAGLASDVRFDVLVYAGDVAACFPTMQLADDERRSAALEFASRTHGSNGTNIHGALLEAIELAELDASGRAASSRPASRGSRPPEVDTIFFLTDGFPTSGLVRAPEAILQEIAGLNRTLRIRIHAVGVGNHDRAFLAALAEQSGGTYVAR